MKKILLLICSVIILNAGILDFLDVSHAQKSYVKKDYKSAIKMYKKVENKNGATYDLANSYYKNGDYKKALREYEKVKSNKLEFKKLHNMGNTYALLGKIDQAIKSYEDALKIKKDKDTKYNLELLLKQKKKQQNKNKNKDKKKNKKNQKNKNKQNENKNKKSDKNNKENKKNKQNQNQHNKQNKKQENKKPKQNQAKKEGKKGEKKKIQKLKKQPIISDMEERKYKKLLNQRGINTLMLPLKTKGDTKNEQNPW